MRLFDEEAAKQDPYNDSSSTYNQIQLPSSGSANWGASADTLRPGSINIPDFDNNDDLGAFAPASTPWFMSSATSSTGGFGQLDTDGKTYSRFGTTMQDEPEEADNRMDINSDYNSSGTLRPGFSSGIDDFNPNPFPKRGRQFSGDSTYTSGPFGGISSGPSFTGSSSTHFAPPAESAEAEKWDFPQSGSPESSASRMQVAQSPSLPTLTTRQEESPTALRSRNSPRALASRLRSNTAPNFDSTLAVGAQNDSSGKNVLNFGSRNASPFAIQRSNNIRRPSALNLPDSNSQNQIPGQDVGQAA